METFTLRDYQKSSAESALKILLEKKIVFLVFEPRVGKTATSFAIIELYKAKNVLFLTKLKAISSIKDDYNNFKPSFNITVINYESLHKVDWSLIDFIVCDESHVLSGFPKPSNKTKILKERVGQLPVILLSATVTPESPSQIYHQFWISENSPFKEFTNFYKWAYEFVNIKKRFVNGYMINDYTNAKESEISAITDPYMVKLSQLDAGFTSFVEEEIITVPINEKMYTLMNVLKRDRVYTMKSGDVIVADTPVKMQSLFHQISSGTVKTTEIKDEKEIAKFHILDESKAWYIKTRFAGHKIAIFYKFIAEGNLLRKIFPNHTDNPQEFNERTDLYFICQIVSGREGTNLSTADALIMYNIDFSATSYWQGRARMQTKDRVIASKMYWLFSEKGLEKHVYKAVVKKQNYTKKFFEKDVKLIGV